MNQQFRNLRILIVFSLFFFGNIAGQDTLRVGSKILEGVVLNPGTISIESFKIHQNVRTPISRSILSIEKTLTDGVPVYSISIIHWAVGKGDSALTTIVVRQKDFALLRHKVNASHDSAVVLYSHGFLSGWVVLPDKPILLIDTRTSYPVFSRRWSGTVVLECFAA